ncbi:replication factor A [Haloplanus halophilus]|uniref:replication factor A n=1 Tax=Haloplanus halophilus TaxID=2949993 RepID=UPI00203F0889|nr:replication factor A [Haloplanus sp. GDY1]
MSTNATPPNSAVDASNDDLATAATDLIEQFPDDVESDLPTVDDIVTRLDQMVNSYNVPLGEATRATRNHYLDALGIEYDDLALRSQNAGDAALDAIDTDGQWVTITVKVVDLWEPTSDSIAQVGLIGDETGRLKFTKWAKANLPELEDGGVYRLDNVVTSEYEGRYSINLNSRSTIERVDDDIEVGDNAEEMTIEAPMVAIQSGSGLIKRCPHEDCTRVLQDGRCAEHGTVEGVFDLRIKAVFDDGVSVQHAIFDQDATEALADTTIEEAKQHAMDALDTTVVANDLTDALVGRYYRVTGRVIGKYLLVDEADPLP